MGEYAFHLSIVQLQQPWFTATIHSTGVLHLLFPKPTDLLPLQGGAGFLAEVSLTLLSTYAKQFMPTTRAVCSLEQFEA